MIQDEWAKSTELYNTTFSREEQILCDEISEIIAKE
jgi:hypothetical protein